MDRVRYSDEEILKQLMTGLIYPAVLGTVIYGTLDYVLGAARMLRDGLHGSASSLDVGMIVKLFSLAVTVAFYCCSYMYTLFTRHYRRKFFLYDIIFTLALYTTYVAIAPGRKPGISLGLISICFIVFFVLYLLWDMEERKNPDNVNIENQLYGNVIKWEAASIPAFCVTALLSFILRPWYVPAVSFLIVLMITTARFAKLTWAKRLYWYK